MWQAEFWLDGELVASFGVGRGSPELEDAFWGWVRQVAENVPPGTECRIRREL